MEFQVEELEYSLQFEGEGRGSLEAAEAGSGLLFDGELVEIVSSGVKSISVNGIMVEADRNRNVEIPVDQMIAAYLEQNLGAGLKLEGGILSVDTVGEAEADNTRPITSAAVYMELGNINALLKTI